MHLAGEASYRMYNVYMSLLIRQIIIINAWDRQLLGYYFAHLNTNNVMIVMVRPNRERDVPIIESS